MDIKSTTIGLNFGRISRKSILKSLLLPVVCGLALGACTSESEDGEQSATTAEATSAEQGQTSTNSEFSSGEDAIESTGSTIEEGISEEPAQPVENELTNDEVEAEIALSDNPDDVDESALQVDAAVACATIEIGKNAIADGETDLVLAQAQALAATEVSDPVLSDLLDQAKAGGALNPDLLESALQRCEELGFER